MRCQHLYLTPRSRVETADVYGEGKNETFIAPFIRANRDRLTIATKFGINRFGPEIHEVLIENSPDYIRKASDDSLQRLGIDVIDLYYTHRRTPALAWLQHQSKVFGLADVTISRTRKPTRVYENVDGRYSILRARICPNSLRLPIE